MKSLSIEDAKIQVADGALIIDARPSVTFVQGFIPGSIHIPEAGLPEYSELLLKPDVPLILLTEDESKTSVGAYLAKIGFASVSGILSGGYAAWTSANGSKDIIIDISPEEFELDYNFDEFYLIDLRDEGQYAEEHFEYAENLPLDELEEAIPDLNPDVMYYLYGNTFEDAAFASALFKRSGFHKLRVVNEGFEALKKTRIPVIKKKNPKGDPHFSAN